MSIEGGEMNAELNAMLVRERQRDLLAHAEADRVARTARATNGRARPAAGRTARAPKVLGPQPATERR